MTENKEFVEISKRIKLLLTNQPNHPDALELYAFYKQATVGDVNIERPSLFNFKGKAKWDSWNKKKGLTQQEAELNYLKLSKKTLNEIAVISNDLYSKAKLIKNVMPQVPLDIIQKDLKITNNEYETITRLLDGTVFFVSEDISVELTDASNDKIKAKTNQQCKTEEQNLNKADIQSNENIVKEANVMKNQSPMSYNTKTSVFEKDPVQRMKSYQERKKKLIEVARAHYIEKHGLNK